MQLNHYPYDSDGTSNEIEDGIISVKHVDEWGKERTYAILFYPSKPLTFTIERPEQIYIKQGRIRVNGIVYGGTTHSTPEFTAGTVLTIECLGPGCAMYVCNYK